MPSGEHSVSLSCVSYLCRVIYDFKHDRCNFCFRQCTRSVDEVLAVDVTRLGVMLLRFNLVTSCIGAVSSQRAVVHSRRTDLKCR